MEDEADEQTALPFPRGNYREMIIDPMMIMYWLKCVVELECYRLKKNVLYLWSPLMELIEELHIDDNV